MAKPYYVVRVGRQTGIFRTWNDCKAQVHKFKGAKFKKFDTQQSAEYALKHGWEDSPNKAKAKKLLNQRVTSPETEYILDSISVDAACSGNPGELEYQCVNTQTGEKIFGSKLYPVGTNNLGEFLAIVDGLRYLKSIGDTTTPIYSDSIIALAWVRNRRVKSNLYRNTKTHELWVDIDKAIDWLYDNDYQNPILKWETKYWGESKADFGRK